MEKFLNQFTDEQRSSGSALLPQAERIFGGPDRLSADVHEGGQLYSVYLCIQDRRLVCRCDCPSKGICHHIWTGLLLAEQSGDLQLALKRTVSQKLCYDAPSDDSSAPDAVKDLCYQRDSSSSRRDDRTVQQGQRLLVYDAPSAESSRHASPLAFDMTHPDLQTQLLFVIPLELQDPSKKTLRFHLFWRQTPQPHCSPAPAKPFLLDEQSVIDSKPLAILLQQQNRQERDRKLPPHAFLLPIENADVFFNALDNRNLLRWSSADEQPKKIHPVKICLNTCIDMDIGFMKACHHYTMMPTAQPILQETFLLFLPPCYLLTPTRLYRAQYHQADDAFLSMVMFSKGTMMPLDAAQRTVRLLSIQTALPLRQIPEELRPQRRTPPPKGKLYIRTAIYKFQGHEQLHAILSFDYQTVSVDEFSSQSLLDASGMHALLQRDPIAEEALRNRLIQLGFRFNSKAGTEEPGWKLHPSRLDEAVRALVLEDWLITAEGKTYRKPQPKRATLSSGLDWFELEAAVDFDGMSVPLPTLLKAQASGAKAVRLDDGTYGLLPLEWLQNFTVLTELGDVDDDRIRFKNQQAALVNAMLHEQCVDFDEQFRQHLSCFQSIVPTPTAPPSSFHAVLRAYQQEGLGWLLTMASLHLGACLADDMGLGKTIQVLAFIDSRRAQGSTRPSLIVVPKSLLFNWQAEAAKFAPHLRVCLHVGPDRQTRPEVLSSFHIVITTYGTLRNDAIKLARCPFDTCVLDESQTIKNAQAAAAEAARLIKADFRIAMTGTPIENSLSELASQLEFLNPGLFGRLFASARFTSSGALPDEMLNRLKKAVHPFILRRTKQQVAHDLPPKTEQVLWCDLSEEQRKEYDDLKLYYQKKILNKQDEKVAGQSTMDTLVALLRLRQAACHPALLDSNRRGAPSAKLDLLMSKIVELSQEHHKILVFSQFTSFLQLIAAQLQSMGLSFNYLDGQTPDRQQQVHDFQTNPSSVAFLISLKAGGVGLNLTAADYIFLMDPWWNPASEAQAIDRAYRIGQTHPVFAYKVIAKDTIEEKVLQMQQQKRTLSHSILNGDDICVPKTLTAEELKDLLQ